MADNNNINTKDFIIGTLIGGMVGAAAALLFAPKSGKELRGDINEGASQVKDRAIELGNTAQEKGAVWKDKAYTTGAELKKKAMDTSSELTKTATEKTKEMTNSVKGKIEEQRRKGESAVDQAANEAQEKVEKVEETAKEVEKTK